MKILPIEFYLDNDVVDIAKMLLGKKIVSRIGNVTTSGIIVETEAYKAPEDKASHAYNNRFTPRTKTMFKQGGIAYIYLIYGFHHMFNIVTAREGMAHAVLIRSIQPVDGIPVMLKRRNMQVITPNLANGPGKLTQALGITRKFDGIHLTDINSKILIYDIGISFKNKIISGPRIGIDYADEWAYVPWRFRVGEE